MTISFSGLGSGIDTSSWVDALVAAKQVPITTLQNKVTALNTTSTNLSNLKNNYSSLLTAVYKLTDSNNSTSANVFAQNKISSSDTSVLSASVTANATPQTLDVIVKNLATSTVATSNSAIGKSIDGSTVFSSLANGAAKTGSFTFYVDNQKFSVNISNTDTLDSIKTKMVDATKTDDNPDGTISVDISGGKFTIDAGDKSIALGSAQDTSNLSSILALKKDTTLNKYSSANSIININMNAKLTDASAGLSTQVTAGTFKIGNATFTIDSNTTLNTLINKINSNTDAGVTANVDPVTGKFSLTSKTTGAFNVNIENGTSNFLDAVGLTSGGKLVAGTQDLGDNARLTINNHDVESFSNTVTSESTGLTGVVLNLSDVTETGKSVKVKIEQDSSQALTAAQAFITQYNNVMSQTDSTMTNDSNLKYDTSLSSLKRNLRSTIAATVNTSGTYKTLADIGITTGAIGTSVTANTNQLQIDTDKFNKAMAADPDSVKQLLIGNGTTTTGLAGAVKKIAEGATSASNGLFASKNTTIQTQLKSLNDRISTGNDSIAAYKKSLQAQFAAMDQTIATLKSQFSKFSSASGTGSSTG